MPVAFLASLSVLEIERRVEGWIVVHLHRAVLLELPPALEDIGPEAVEALDEVIALLDEDVVAFAIALGVAGRGVDPVDLFGGVEEFQRKDREAVDDLSRSFGVKLGVLIGQAVALEVIEQDGVAVFGEVVAALIFAVDEMLGDGHLMVAGGGHPGLVLGVPDAKVGEVVGKGGLQEVSAGLIDGLRELSMPLPRPAVVKNGDFSSG